MGSLKGDGQWDHSFRDDEGNDKLNVGIFHMQSP